MLRPAAILVVALTLVVAAATASPAASPPPRFCGYVAQADAVRLTYPARHARRVSCRAARRIARRAVHLMGVAVIGDWTCHPRAADTAAPIATCFLDGGGREARHAIIRVYDEAVAEPAPTSPLR